MLDIKYKIQDLRQCLWACQSTISSEHFLCQARWILCLLWTLYVTVGTCGRWNSRVSYGWRLHWSLLVSSQNYTRPLLTGRKKGQILTWNIWNGTASVVDAHLFWSSYLKALIFSTVIDLRTLARVVHMSDCFPSFVYFGKVFPVEEINKFQGDIFFFI